jgi:hypothetical protein
MLYIFSIFCLCIQPVLAARYDVTGLIVESVSQNEDDEEAPFDIRATNKRHKCGGGISNLFRVYSEFNIVSDRKFDMAIISMKNNLTLSVSTHGCEGKALTVERMRISR